MKRICSILVLAGIFTTTAVQAQDNKAKTILNKVTQKIKHAKAVSAQFTFSVLDAQGKSRLSKSGSFQMKGEQYKVVLNDGQQIISDGKSVWVYLSKTNEVQITPYDPEEQTISPSQLFSGSFEKDYNYTYSGSRTISGQKVDVITLKPKSSSKSFSKVVLYVNSQYMIAGGNVEDKSGNSYVYKISNVKTTTDIANSVFHFNPKSHPGVDIIDLR